MAQESHMVLARRDSAGKTDIRQVVVKFTEITTQMSRCRGSV